MATLKELRDNRIEKLNKLVEKGINPFPTNGDKDASNQDIIDNYSDYEGKTITLSGRIMSWRGHGGLAFVDIMDQSGRIQLYIHEEELEETSKANQTLGFEDLKLLDIGDFIEAKGEVTKTQRGEISLRPKTIRILTKAVRPLPEKWEGLKDKEVRYRRRYLDLTMNQEVRAMFERKAKFWEANRKFMKDHGFLEVETPILEHIPGGADARPFITHMNALDQDFYLRISPELYLKRLVGGGFEKVYVIGPNFRNEGLSDEHLAEFYNIEWYWAYADYRQNMELVRDSMRYVAREVYGTTKFTKGKHEFDLDDEWKEIDYIKIIKDTHGVDIFTTPDEELMKVLKHHHVELPGAVNRFRMIDNLWKLIRKDIAGPAFLLNEPKFMSPLAKSKPDNDELTERFHVIIAGAELGNGYSELNDPFDQYERFAEQQSAKDEGDDEAQMMDIDYVEMLEYGMPPTSGYAHGERLFWFLENVTAREGTLFPQMRHNLDQTTKEIYSINAPEAPIKATNSYKTIDESSKRFVAVLNSKVDTGKLMNALGHLSAGMASGLLDAEEIVLVDYVDKEEAQHAVLSHFPFIVLQADNSNQLRALREAAMQEGITMSDFTSTMTVGTSVKQVEETEAKSADELEYFAVLLFGETEKLKGLTKKFSLFK